MGLAIFWEEDFTVENWPFGGKLTSFHAAGNGKTQIWRGCSHFPPNFSGHFRAENLSVEKAGPTME